MVCRKPRSRARMQWNIFILAFFSCAWKTLAQSSGLVPCDLYLRALTIKDAGVTDVTAPVTFHCKTRQGALLHPLHLSQGQAIEATASNERFYLRERLGSLVEGDAVSCSAEVGGSNVIPAGDDPCWFKYEDFDIGSMSAQSCNVRTGTYVLQCLYNPIAAIEHARKAAASSLTTGAEPGKLPTYADAWAKDQVSGWSSYYLTAAGLVLGACLVMFVAAATTRGQSPLRQWSVSMADLEANDMEAGGAHQVPEFFEALSPTHSRALKSRVDQGHPVIILTPSNSSANFYIGIPEIAMSTLHREGSTVSMESLASALEAAAATSENTPMLSPGQGFTRPRPTHRRSASASLDFDVGRIDVDLNADKVPLSLQASPRCSPPGSGAATSLKRSPAASACHTPRASSRLNPAASGMQQRRTAAAAAAAAAAASSGGAGSSGAGVGASAEQRPLTPQPAAERMSLRRAFSLSRLLQRRSLGSSEEFMVAMHPHSELDGGSSDLSAPLLEEEGSGDFDAASGVASTAGLRNRRSDSPLPRRPRTTSPLPRRPRTAPGGMDGGSTSASSSSTAAAAAAAATSSGKFL